LLFSFTGVLDKSGFKNNIDWGLMLLTGVLLSLAGLIPVLKVDRWLIGSMSPILSVFSFHPLPFLLVVSLAVYVLCFFLRKTPAVILLMLSLTSWAQDIGIHPGVLLLSILMAIDSWFLPYQSDYYQITYYSTGEKAFSHAQARKLMLAKFVSSLLAITISVPYWQMLGFIR
jgi:di/tricarboxylate transporter